MSRPNQVVKFVVFARTSADSMARDVGFGPSQWTYHVDLYVAPWNRYQPYLVGALLGYVLHHTRGQKIRLDRFVNLVVWQVMIKKTRCKVRLSTNNVVVALSCCYLMR